MSEDWKVLVSNTLFHIEQWVMNLNKSKNLSHFGIQGEAKNYKNKNGS